MTPTSGAIIRAAARPPLRRVARGFTLVEMLVVVVIMSVLATIGMPMAELAQRHAKEEELRRSLREIRTALDAYRRLADEGRIERPAGGSGYPPKLDVLVDGVVDAKSPGGAKIYLLRGLPRDPFSDAAADTPAAATWAPRSYASPPNDPKAGEDVFDVHSKSPKTGMDGTAYAAW